MKGNKRGFVLLEAMLLVMLVLSASTLSIGLSSASLRRLGRQAAKRESRDAALAAVRLMAERLWRNEEAGLSAVETVDRTLGRLPCDAVLSINGEGETVSVPVRVSYCASEAEGTVTLYAQAGVRGETQTAALTLKREEEDWIFLYYEFSEEEE